MRIRGALLFVCVWIATAAAETPQEQADKLFAEGRELLTKNDSAGACEKFEAAIKLDPTATGTMLNLGLCYENLEKYASSLKWFRRAQASAAENQLDEYKTAAEEHTVTISPKVATLTLTVDGPPGVEVLVDGARIESTEFGRVEVDAGSHEVVGRAPGKKRVVMTVEVTGAENKAVSIVVSEAAVPVYRDLGKARRRAALIVGGGGVVALGGVLVWGLVERGIQKDADRALDMDKKNASNRRLKWGTTSLFAVGLGAVAVGTALYFTAAGKERISDGTAWTPVVGGDQLGFALSGSF